jgi:hypothetical protein
VIELIREMIRESINFRNDGWVQQGYKDKLKLIYKTIGQAFPEFKKEYHNAKEKQNTKTSHR